MYALSAERISNEQLSVFVAVPAASGASLAQMDPRQDEQWVEAHKPDYPEEPHREAKAANTKDADN